MTNANDREDITLLVNVATLTKSLFRGLKQEAVIVSLDKNANKTDFMSLN